MATLEGDLWFSKIKFSYGVRIEVDGTDPLRIHYDRMKIGPTTIDATGKVDSLLLSINMFDGSHVGEVRVVTYEEKLRLGIGLRADGKTIAPLTTEYSASISSRTELDFEIRLGKTAVALALPVIFLIAPQLAEEFTKSPAYAQ